MARGREGGVGEEAGVGERERGVAVVVVVEGGMVTVMGEGVTVKGMAEMAREGWGLEALARVGAGLALVAWGWALVAWGLGAEAMVVKERVRERVTVVAGMAAAVVAVLLLHKR